MKKQSLRRSLIQNSWITRTLGYVPIGVYWLDSHSTFDVNIMVKHWLKERFDYHIIKAADIYLDWAGEELKTPKFNRRRYGRSAIIRVPITWLYRQKSFQAAVVAFSMTNH